jgi:hypothetical protein
MMVSGRKPKRLGGNLAPVLLPSPPNNVNIDVHSVRMFDGFAWMCNLVFHIKGRT